MSEWDRTEKRVLTSPLLQDVSKGAGPFAVREDPPSNDKTLLSTPDFTLFPPKGGCPSWHYFYFRCNSVYVDLSSRTRDHWPSPLDGRRFSGSTVSDPPSCPLLRLPRPTDDRTLRPSPVGTRFFGAVGRKWKPGTRGKVSTGSSPVSDSLKGGRARHRGFVPGPEGW